MPEPVEIDQLNILHATMLAMQRAVAGLHIAPDMVLIDGNRCPKLPMRSLAVVKGDSRVAEISAASILAKVTRDREMTELDAIFPDYGLCPTQGLSHRVPSGKAGRVGGYRASSPQLCPGKTGAGVWLVS
ncbi:Ribonuclease HII [Serratia fonticola]|uniref:Ribonuclease n=1 Tax=Serratia fonticola TaxID=47917 RepID=A0A4U9WPL7_SERFO|nr:Ribonuclease HII [Serratia fonticola]